MKGWMGGRRRRMDVERRDPVARQRQFFARRREQRGRAQHPPPLPPRDRINARRYLDSFRHGSHPVANANARNQVQARFMNQYGKDVLFVVPEARNAVLSEIAALGNRGRRGEGAQERDNDEKENGKMEEDEPLRNLELLSEANRDDENEIRIFDNDQERTHRFRRRILPEDFLNSDRTHIAEGSHVRKRPLENSERSAAPSQELQVKRLKRCTADVSATQHYNGQEPGVSDWRPRLSTSPREYGPRRLERDHESYISLTRTHRIQGCTSPRRPPQTRSLRLDHVQPERHPVQPLRNRTRSRELNDDTEPKKRIKTRAFRLDSPATSLRNTNSSKHQSEDSVPYSCARSAAVLDDVEQVVIPPTAYKQDHHDWSYHAAIPASDEEDESRPALLKSGRAGIGPVDPINILQKFPPVEFDSESDCASNEDRDAICVHDSFACILSREPFRLDQISAEVLEIEDKMLDLPDQDVRVFSQPRGPLNPTNRQMVAFPQPGQMLATDGNAQRERNTSPAVGKENVAPEDGRPRSNAHAAPGNQNPEPRPALLNVDVTLSLSQMNPVTNAAVIEASESNQLQENSSAS